MIKTVRARFDDFINSKYHKDSTPLLSTASIANHQTYYSSYENLAKETKTNLRIVVKGSSELRQFANSIYGFKNLEPDDSLCIKFENFTLYFLKIFITRKLDVRSVAVLADFRSMWLPRKSPVVYSKTENSILVVDDFTSITKIFKLPELYYPQDKNDIKEMLYWMRYKKRVLCIRYRISDEKYTRTVPSWRDNLLHWEKKARVFVADDVAVQWSLAYPCQTLRVDYAKNTPEMDGVFPYAVDSDLNNRSIIIYPIKPITQELVDEYVEWTKTRYKITY